MSLSPKAREEYNSYMREWRRAHKENVRRNNEKYWEKKSGEEPAKAFELSSVKSGMLAVLAQEDTRDGDKQSFFALVLPDSRGYLCFYPFSIYPSDNACLLRKNQFLSIDDEVRVGEFCKVYILRIFGQSAPGDPFFDLCPMNPSLGPDFLVPHTAGREVIYDRLCGETIDF